MKRIPTALAAAFIAFVLASCASIPKGVRAVEGFEPERYLGSWYEIARFDFSFERNLDHTTANYSRNPDGTIRVENSGYDYVAKKQKNAIGRARLRGSPSVAELEVSFFGPFYSGYNVILLDPDYRYALVSGQSRRYLWILARESSIPEEVKRSYVAEAERLGYQVGDLVWVDQAR